MNRLRIITALSAILMTSSCEKQEALSKQQAELEAAYNQGSVELQSLDAQIASLFPNNALPELQHANWLNKNSELEKVLAELTKKCSQGDELLKKVHAKLDAFKALNAQ